MAENLGNKSSGPGPASSEGARKSIVLPVVVIALVVVLAVVLTRKRAEEPAPSTSLPVETHNAVRPDATQASSPSPTTSAEAVPTLPPPPPPTKVPQPVASKPPTPEPAAAAGPAPSAYTRQLMSNLAGLDVSKGISPEQAEQWKGELQKLIKEGAGSVPAIREFLEKNVDLNFDGAPGGNPLGVPSLRLALFDALAQIGGPEAIGLAHRTLMTTADPREIAILARTLDQMDPGQHREAAVAAAREALALAAKDTRAMDVAPAFEVLLKFGDSTTAQELEQAATTWNYYAPMALASMTNGAGVPSLIRLAQDTDGRYRSSSRFALQMLAQLAPQYPEAEKALLEQVKAQRIPEAAWYGIASALAGTQMFPNTSYLETVVPPTNTRDPKSYSIPVNQQFYRSFDVSLNWTPEQLQKQLQLIDQLRAASPAAAAALEPTRAALAARLGQ